MKKLFTVSLLAGLLSMPSIVLAEASWYGSIRAGVQSNAHNTGTAAAPTYKGSTVGVADFGSRWGIMGSSEVSEGLTAVYRWETKINSPDASEPGGRLSYVGLSGGFGTISIGQLASASSNHFGVDQAAWLANDSVVGNSSRTANTVSYAVSVGNLSMQADARMNSKTKKTGDAFEIGATIGGLMETASLSFVHIRHEDGAAIPHDSNGTVEGGAVSSIPKSSTNFVSARYGIGGMTMHLGVGKKQTKNDGCFVASADGQVTDADCVSKNIETSTFAGIGGSVGDTGVNYVFQMVKNKTKTTDRTGDPDPSDGDDDATGAVNVTNMSSSPWTFGLSRSLGGGASVYLEHAESATKGKAATTAVWLQVDF